MIVLGLSQDRFEGGVAVGDGTRILFAANEERFTRRKNEGGWPAGALAAAWRATGLHPRHVGAVAVAGIATPPLPARALPGLQRWLFAGDHDPAARGRRWLVDRLAYGAGLARGVRGRRGRQLAAGLASAAVRRLLPPEVRHAPVHVVEHHRAHAAAAWVLSGFDAALCVTADGVGDGLCMTVSRCSPAGIERLWEVPAFHSFGLFYEQVTAALGFVPNRHEGKVTGLAAHGDPRAVAVPSPFRFDGQRLVYAGPRGASGVAWARRVLAECHRREDVAAWAQAVLEDGVGAVVDHWLRRTGLRRLVLAGGVFANVRLNQRLAARPGVAEIFVCPNMGDGGLAVGALAAAGGFRPGAVGDVFWGDAPARADMLAAVRARGLEPAEPEDLPRCVARHLAAGGLVARCDGRMEWGPRALGNRSVLASARDRAVVGRLNRCLGRSEFMPFAPAVAAEEADRWFADLGPVRRAAEFMTACATATPALRAEHPAVVHVDGTARPQLVRRETNPALHAILAAYRRETGAGVLINTSFNLHEEPIVRTPAEAVDTFVRSGLDWLVLGSFLVAAPGRAAGRGGGVAEAA